MKHNIKVILITILLLVFNYNLISNSSKTPYFISNETDTSSFIVIGIKTELITSFNDSIVVIKSNFNQICNYSNIKFLGLFNINPDTIRKFIRCFPDLMRIHWNDSELQQLPDEIFSLQHIKKASFFLPKMKVFPDKINLWKEIEYLCINNTEIHLIPEGIGLLSNLRTLDLNSNQINYISPSIGALINLTYIDISFNQLDSLPPTFTQLENLNYIKMDYNRLKTLPFGFSKMKDIQYINMCFNKLTDLPKDFKKISKKHIRIEWYQNPWNEKDLEILKKYPPYSDGKN